MLVEKGTGLGAGVDCVPPGLRNGEKELIFAVFAHCLVRVRLACERTVSQESFVVCDNPWSQLESGPDIPHLTFLGSNRKGHSLRR